MSESLPGTALPEEPAAPTVVDDAPGTPEAVGTDSAQAPTGMVEASRFNGLMGKFNQTQNALQAAAAERDALQARIQELESRGTAQEGTVTDAQTNPQVEQLTAQVSQLANMLMKSERQNALSSALKEFPEAEMFADLIVADSPEDIRGMAQVLAERVRKANGSTTDEVTDPVTDPPAGESNPPAADPPAPPAPVVAGGVTVSGDVTASDKVTEAIQKKSFGDFLKARREQAAQSDLVLS